MRIFLDHSESNLESYIGRGREKVCVQIVAQHLEKLTQDMIYLCDPL